MKDTPKRIDQEIQRQAIELYRLPQKLSPRKIGEQLGISSWTVRNILVRNNETRRSPGRPQTYEKTDFSGEPREKARIIGFVEDCGARHHGKQIHVQTSTTHPAQLNLFDDIFDSYGHVCRTPIYNKHCSYYELQPYVYLNDSFDFLSEYKSNPMKFLAETTKNGHEIVRIASLTDTEGWIGIDKDNGYSRVCLSISNSNRRLLEWTQRTIGGDIGRDKDGYQLRLYRKEAVEVLRRLPLAHAEKVASKELILRHYNNGDIGLEALREYRELRGMINEEVQSCKMQARLEWIRRHGKPHKDDPDQTMP